MELIADRLWQQRESGRWDIRHERTRIQWLMRLQSLKAALSAILRDNWGRFVLFSRNARTAETGHECKQGGDYMHEIPETGFLRLPQVLSVIPLGKTCWWEGVKSGRFPKPVKLSARCTAWRAEDIRELIKSLSELESSATNQSTNH
jgi:predicted DNA-binding transcriptional regulator AlpA